jgi:glutathione S-transferase
MSKPDVILHQYEMSPYSEKVRLAFGLKNLAWRSVEIPMVMPKPDLTALTGGYRKTPVMQIGADIYCDTKLILRKLDQLRPDPSLIPSGTEALQAALTKLGDTMFTAVVATFFGSDQSIFTPDFIEDRQKIIPGGIDLDLAKAMLPAKLDQLRAHLAMVESTLAGAGPFLTGDAPSAADLALRHVILFASVGAESAPLLAACPAIAQWAQRVDALGHGQRTELDAAEAIAIARGATSTTEAYVDSGDPNARTPGDRITVMAEDYARDPVVGELVYADVGEIALKRVDERAGEVVVHFPREDFAVLPAG